MAPAANPLTDKIGPLPLWGWLAVGAAGIYFFMRGSGAATTAASSQAAQAAGAQQYLPYPTYQDYGSYGSQQQQPSIIVLPSAVPPSVPTEAGTSTPTITAGGGTQAAPSLPPEYYYGAAYGPQAPGGGPINAQNFALFSPSQVAALEQPVPGVGGGSYIWVPPGADQASQGPFFLQPEPGVFTPSQALPPGKGGALYIRSPGS